MRCAVGGLTPLPRLLDLPIADLPAALKALRPPLPRFRATQILDGVFRKGATCVDKLTQLSAVERTALGAAYTLGVGSVSALARSTDGTQKFLIATADGGPRVETVLIPGTKPTSLTLCLSSQAGCSLRCAFCHTGTQAMEKNLSVSDIVSQAILVNSALRSSQRNDGDGSSLSMSSIRRVVFMGQGEPLFNWRSVRGAIGYLTSPLGLGLAAHRLTLSTAGVAPLIPRVADEAPGVRLAVSLHAGDDDTRSRIMDINSRWPVHDVMTACAEFVGRRADAARASRATVPGAATSSSSSDEVDSDDDEGAVGGDGGQQSSSQARAAGLPSLHGTDSHNGPSRVRVSFEVVMLDRVNDSVQHAVSLCLLLRKHLPLPACHVNLIVFNSWPGAPFSGSSMERILRFQRECTARGIRTTIRASKGVDVLGACGQLRSSAVDKQRQQQSLQAGAGVDKPLGGPPLTSSHARQQAG